MAKGKGKGSSFERDVAKRLSAWWTRKGNVDCLWRSAMSGGKATVTGSSVGTGDLVAVNPDGNGLVQRVCFELKRGYPMADWFSIVESSRTSTIIKGFVEQAKTSAKLGGCPMWCIIHKRDRRVPLVIFDGGFGEQLERLVLNSNAFADNHAATFTLYEQPTGLNVCGTTLDAFLQINPDMFAEAVDGCNVVSD